MPVDAVVALQDADPFVVRALRAAGYPVLELTADNFNREGEDAAAIEAAITAFIEGPASSAGGGGAPCRRLKASRSSISPRVLPGAYASWIAADMGAEVIRIEHPRELAKRRRRFGSADPPRATAPGRAIPATSAAWRSTPARQRRGRCSKR